jgi:hypothetical protein
MGDFSSDFSGDFDILIAEPPAPAQTRLTFGGLIDIRVEIDTGEDGSLAGQWDVSQWDEAVWGSSDPGWFDITDTVYAVDTELGAERWGERFEGGRATIIVDDTDGRYTPISGVDAFHLPFRPGRGIRVVAIPDADTGTKVPLWTGYVEAVYPDYADAGHGITARLECLDHMALFEQHNPYALTIPTGVQDTDARVEAALDRLDWPAGLRDIQAGAHTMQTSHLAQSTLEECARAADAEGGAFFAGPDGSAVFRARDWLTTDTRSVNIQGWLGYTSVAEGDDQAALLELEPSWERTRIINHVAMARVGSTMQEVQDLTSQALHRVKSYRRTDLENNTDAEVAFLAARILEAFKDERLRLDAVTIHGIDDPDAEDLNRLMYDTQIGDRLAVLVTPPHGWSYETEVHVMGVAHHITVDDWEVTLRLDDALTWEES